MDELYYASGSLYYSKGKYFYEDGTLKTVERHLDGKLTGESSLYWPNGKIKRLCNFKEGIRVGLDQMFSDEGVLLDEGYYEAGKPTGTHRRFNEKGSLIEEIEYLDDVRFNMSRWDDEGKLRVHAEWTSPDEYREKIWDRFQNKWIEKRGRFDGQKLVYL